MGALLLGALATISLTFFRVALPWPLKGILEAAFPGGQSGSATTLDSLPATSDPVLWLCVAYAVIALGAGASELFQRVYMARYAAQLTDNLRATVIRRVMERRAGGQDASPGELVGRITADSTGLKSGLSGALVHVSKNALLFICICALLTWVSPQLGLVFLGAGLVVILIGMRSARRVARHTERHRDKELAEGELMLQMFEQPYAGEPGEDAPLDGTPREMRTVRAVAWSMFVSSTVLGGIIALAAWIGVGQVRDGTLAPGELFLFFAYAITVHRRLVQLGRQVARSGRIGVSARRLLALAPARGSAVARSGLRESIALKDVVLKSAHSGTRLRLEALALKPAEWVAVLGKAGAGKSTLLHVLAGSIEPDSGQVLWDGVDLRQDPVVHEGQVALLDQHPRFLKGQVATLLGPQFAEADPATVSMLKKIGAASLVKRLKRGADQRVSSTQLSENEARMLALASLLARDCPVWLLDDPFLGLSKAKAERRLGEVLARADGRLLVVAMSRPVGLERFHRVLELRKGRCVFDGPPGSRNAQVQEGGAPCKD